MTGDELQKELQRAGLGQIEAASKHLDLNPAVLRRLIAGEIPVPEEIAQKARQLPDRPERPPAV